ncbi:LytTR family DNA-binding domain-containing protein [Enterococcus cecorum]|uniref:LytR/AlgR family response regulator transcription factor n=1 Tax=Enterococcus cecorum TaxID=44008 RepID=UPI00148B8C34|nr:LytTR family DNA-binding domain-containing protein [Enterococcus cecorum]MCJ0579598.1 LytTR family DNA-binding domain-containing protein [Enterococcus cecorum]
MIFAICDDERLFQETLEEQLYSLCKKMKIDVTILKFNNGQEVLNYITKPHSTSIDMLFLDIDMPEMDGLTLKDKLSNQKLVRYIVFTTNHQEHIYEAFGTKTLGFLNKPTNDFDLEKKIQQYLQITEKEKVLEFTDIFNVIHRHSIDEFVYFKVDDRYIEVHLVNKKDNFLILSQIKDLEQKFVELPFIRCHKSYIISLIQSEKITVTSASLSNQETIPVGRRFYPKLKEAYFTFRRDLVWRSI